MSSKEFSTVEVSLGDRSYPVVVGYDLFAEIDRYVSSRYEKVAVITQAEIPWQLDLSVEFEVFTIPGGEDAKSLRVVDEVSSKLAQFGLKRNHLIVALGGGVVTDLGGFVASTYYRGMDYMNVATTLLGMVDAAIGGKTAVNLREGKNLVGSFWQPKAVFCDLETLKTLPESQRRSGFGEMAKYSFLSSYTLQDLSLMDQVTKCIEIKAGYVASDEREGGRRALLNYGHTLGHAIEAQGFDRSLTQRLTHGEAVAVGIYFAAKLALSMDRIDETRLEEHLQVIHGYGLNEQLPNWIQRDSLLEYMKRDKKSTGTLTFVLDGKEGLEVVRDISESVVQEVLSEF